MITGIGIELDLSAMSLDRMTTLARRAEAGGLDLVALTGRDADTDDGPDLWTAAVWLTAQTERITVATRPPDSPFPAVSAKALDSIDRLAPTRLTTSDEVWARGPASLDMPSIHRLGAGAASVVVPVRTDGDVDRVIRLARERADVPHQRRSTAARSRRRSGIAYDSVPESLAERAIEPGDPEYRSVSSTYLRGGAPGIVLRPRTVDEVADAVSFARQHTELPLGVRSGGHGISGRSTNDGGVVIDVGAMDQIEVLDEERRLVRIGPGARWKGVAASLDGRGWALGSGDYGGVGVGGLATAGGIGYLSRKHGLTIDSLRAVELVLADGRQVRASANENPDLFWAVRGAGANFGIVTAFEFEVSEVAEVGWAQLVLVVPDIAAALLRFGEIATAAPRDTTVFLMTGRPQQGQSIVRLYGMVESSDPAVIVERLTPFAELGSLAQQHVAITRYVEVMNMAPDVGPEGHHGVGDPVARSAFITTITPKFAADISSFLDTGLVHFFQLRTMGGAIADVPDDQTAFAHRTPAFQATAMGADRHSLDDAWDRLSEHFEGLYLSFETDLRRERLNDAFPPAVLERLRQLKHQYDPDNLFRDNFNIDAEHGNGESR